MASTWHCSQVLAGHPVILLTWRGNVISAYWQSTPTELKSSICLPPIFHNFVTPRVSENNLSPLILSADNFTSTYLPITFVSHQSCAIGAAITILKKLI